MPGDPSSSLLVSAPARRIGMLSTYPPTLCGLATFAAALTDTLRRSGQRVDVIAIGGAATAMGTTAVAGRLVNGNPASRRAAIALMNRCDSVIIQHEYGIFGGADGDEVLEILEALDVPAIVVLHTVPLVPTTRQHDILVALGELADRLVVMTEAAHDRLLANYPVDPAKIEVIPHGAATPQPVRGPVTERWNSERPQLLTWGLLGPGKGLEHVIDALALLGDIRPRPRYTIAGVTHPNVLARDGDRYRRSLVRRAELLGLADSVTFDAAYRDVPELTRFVASASVVVLPYDSRDQVTSGVLVDAIAAGRPVIATAFPHAVELLSTGAGIVVPHGDPVALAAAIRRVVTEPGVLATMAAEARRIAPSLGWSAVARRYLLVSDLLAPARQSVAS